MPAYTSTDAMIPVTIVAMLELPSGIIAACIPACMPVFKHKFEGIQVSGKFPFVRGHGHNTGSSKPRSRLAGVEEALQGGHESDLQPLSPLRIKATTTISCV